MLIELLTRFIIRRYQKNQQNLRAFFKQILDQVYLPQLFSNQPSFMYIQPSPLVQTYEFYSRRICYLSKLFASIKFYLAIYILTSSIRLKLRLQCYEVIQITLVRTLIAFQQSALEKQILEIFVRTTGIRLSRFYFQAISISIWDSLSARQWFLCCFSNKMDRCIISNRQRDWLDVASFEIIEVQIQAAAQFQSALIRQEAYMLSLQQEIKHQ